jgi:hypothetical protein
MQKTLSCIYSLFLFSFFVAACGPTSKNNCTSLTVFKDFDKSRKFDTTGNEQVPLYFRPVKIDLFHPAKNATGKVPLTYGELLDMYEQRMNYNISPDLCKKASANLAKMIAEYLHVDSASKILAYQTTIYSNLQLPTKRYPLLIYAAGMNGSSWENPILFDSLVKAGYVVAAISSVGKFPGFMSDAVDLDEQVQDILYATKKIKQLPFIDSSKIGLLSWSLGGSAITKAAMLSNDYKCLLSFDGTEIHYYGVDKAWDKQFNEIMHIPPFKPGVITVPYMYLSSEHPSNIDSLYVFPQHISSREKYFLQFNGGLHENFSSIIPVAKKADPALGNIDSSRHEIICGLTITFFNQYLQQSNINTASYIDKLVADKPASFSTAYPNK